MIMEVKKIPGRFKISCDDYGIDTHSRRQCDLNLFSLATLSAEQYSQQMGLFVLLLTTSHSLYFELINFKMTVI